MRLIKLLISITALLGLLIMGTSKPASAKEISQHSKASMVYQSGDTTIDYASSLDFGTNQINTKDNVYYAKAQEMKNRASRPNYIQVSNLTGKLGGWTLNVKQSQQFKSNKTNKELTGAVLHYGHAELASVSSDKKPSYYQKDFDLSVGADKTVVSATGDQGYGTWIYRFGNMETKDKSVSLAIPKATTKMAEVYQTEVTWSLNNAPTNK
ncbi:WxL domain-containing protein [Dellaglioa sp. BT-FLS60]